MSDTIDLGTRPALVRAMRQESEGVLSVRLEPIDGVMAPWEPGAHLDIVLPAGAGSRQYSLCGDPGDDGYRIAVLHEPDGRGGSDYLHRTLRVGDVVDVKGPRNHFALEEAPEYLLVAGGIGITPLLPMMARLESEGRPWSLSYAGRTTASMAFLGEVAQYGEKVAVLAKDAGGVLDIDALLDDSAEDALVYVCGPQRLLDGIREGMVARGRESQLRTELFAAPEGDEAPVSSDGFVVELATSGLTLTVPPDRSILEVVTAAGVDVMTDCEEGICGSCETHVLDGVPEHRDFVLTPQERAANDCMMICVSRAACPVLTLDL